MLLERRNEKRGKNKWNSYIICKKKKSFFNQKTVWIGYHHCRIFFFFFFFFFCYWINWCCNLVAKKKNCFICIKIILAAVITINNTTSFFFSTFPSYGYQKYFDLEKFHFFKQQLLSVHKIYKRLNLLLHYMHLQNWFFFFFFDCNLKFL